MRFSFLCGFIYLLTVFTQSGKHLKGHYVCPFFPTLYIVVQVLFGSNRTACVM